MYNLVQQRNQIAYGVKKFIVDGEADVEKIPTSTLAPGSSAFMPKTGDIYIYQPDNTWIKMPKSTGAVSNDFIIQPNYHFSSPSGILGN